MMEESQKFNLNYQTYNVIVAFYSYLGTKQNKINIFKVTVLLLD